MTLRSLPSPSTPTNSAVTGFSLWILGQVSRLAKVMILSLPHLPRHPQDRDRLVVHFPAGSDSEGPRAVRLGRQVNLTDTTSDGQCRQDDYLLEQGGRKMEAGQACEWSAWASFRPTRN